MDHTKRLPKSSAGMTWALLVMGCLVIAAPARGQTTLYTFNGDSASDVLGWSVSGAGDVNGDGFADLIVGAPDVDVTSSGSARVFSGFDGSVLYTFNGDSADDLFGQSVSGAGDVDGDGFADLIVGAPRDDNNGVNSGSALVFSGLDGSILYTFDGASIHDSFGWSVSGAGDVNGDGFADLIVGALFHDDFFNGIDSGSARVLSGADGSILYTFIGDSAGDQFGGSVSGAGDVNGDGFADLIVGAIFDDNNGTNSGSARVFSGFDGSILYTFDGDSAFDALGFSVSGAGDVNDDGFDDLIVGAPQDDNNGPGSGSARVFSGLDGSVLFTFNGDSASDVFGFSVSGAGDVNADGFADLIVGAVGDDNNGTNSGSARVISGRPNALTLLELLIQDVEDLNLQQGINNSLDAKLDAVLNALDDLNVNNDQAAVNVLQAFINAVQAQSGNQIPTADADALIAKAQEVIDLLSSP